MKASSIVTLTSSRLGRLLYFAGTVKLWEFPGKAEVYPFEIITIFLLAVLVEIPGIEFLQRQYLWPSRKSDRRLSEKLDKAV